MIASPKALLFVALQNHIKALVDGSNKPYFRFIDRDFGQLENYAPGTGALPPVTFPCVLITIDDVMYQNLQAPAQQGTGTIKLRIGFPPYSGTANITPPEYRDKALYYYELEQLLFTHLHNWAPSTVTIRPAEGEDPAVTDDLSDTYGPLTRTRDYTEERTDFVIVQCQHYSITIDDYTALLSPILVPAPPVNITFE